MDSYRNFPAMNILFATLVAVITWIKRMLSGNRIILNYWKWSSLSTVSCPMNRFACLGAGVALGRLDFVASEWRCDAYQFCRSEPPWRALRRSRCTHLLLSAGPLYGSLYCTYKQGDQVSVFSVSPSEWALKVCFNCCLVNLPHSLFLGVQLSAK